MKKFLRYFALIAIPLLLSFHGKSQTIETFTTSGTWVCPAGITSVTVECWGGGGAGGGSSSEAVMGGGGGAGGTYVSKVVAVVPGQSYSYTVGNGGAGGTSTGGTGGASWFESTSTVYAQGGAGGSAPNGGTSSGGTGSTSLSIGSTKYAGGNGGNGSATISGGGGGGAGSGGVGGNAVGYNAGLGTAFGGGNGATGDDTPATESDGLTGFTYGGGGSGAMVTDKSDHSGGNGAKGAIKLTYSPCTILTIPYTESFESITAANTLPECMAATNLGTRVFTYISNPGSYNRTPRTGSDFASFYYPSDDWIFTQPLALNAGYTYNFSFWYITDGYSGWTTLEAKFGTAQNSGAMTTAISGATVSGPTNTNYVQITGTFSPSSTGTYYCGIHCLSTSVPYYLSIDDINITSLPLCTGVPDGGTTVTSASPVCPGITVNLTVTGGEVASGLSYQWQSSPNNSVWTDITGATANIYSTTMTSTLWFRRKITCGTFSSYSTPVQVIYSFTTACYCTSSATSSYDMDIGNVTFGTINNTSECVSLTGTQGVATGTAGMYSNFYNTVPAPFFMRGSTYPLSVTIPACGSSYGHRVDVYIDFNRNGLLTDPGESFAIYAYTSTGTHTVNYNLAIPAGASTGSTLMRIVVVEASTASPCGTYTWGETEDYQINIIAPPTAAATITEVYPTSFYADKGKLLTITGTQLGGATVTLGGVTGTVVSNTGTQLTVQFPAGNYISNILSLDNGFNPDPTATVNVLKRNIIPVDDNAAANDDTHQTIQSALSGLYSWYGNTSFDAGQLPGGKTIEVYTGTYTTENTPNTALVPTAASPLIIQCATGNQPVVNATGKNYGFNINENYVTVKGFTVYGANTTNILSQGDNCEISYNKCYNSLTGIMAYKTTNILHNLVYDNDLNGIHIENGESAVIESNTVSNNGARPNGASGYIREVDLAGGPLNIYGFEYMSAWTQITSVDDATYVVDFGGGNGMPFNFSFWGTDYTTSDVLGISSNGILRFGSSTNITYFNHPLSQDYTNNNSLSCYWDDMDADSYTADGEIVYTVTGTAPYRRLIVVWHNRTHYSHRDDVGADNGDVVDVECKIFETTNVIEFHYKDLVYDATLTDDRDWASSATIGIKKDGTTYDQYHFSSEDNTPQVDVDHNLQLGAIRYTPVGGGGSGIYLASGSTTLKNNIITSYTETTPGTCFALTTGATATYTSTYNSYYKGTVNTNLVKINGTPYANLAAWSGDGTGDAETDPLFVASGTDFHIKSSAAGRSYHNGEWPPLTATTGTWIADGTLSPCVDLGDASSAYSLEPLMNGARINKGCYGNTLQATRTAVLTGYWVGAVSTEWANPANWSDGVLPTCALDAKIDPTYVTTGFYPIITTSANVKTLTIFTGANLQIAPSGALTVCTSIINNAGITGLVVKSDATGDGSLIQPTTNTNVQATIEKYIPGLRYHYIGTPIAGITDASIGISNPQFYKWNASLTWDGMGATPPTSIDYGPWGDGITPLTYTGTLDLGAGYAYYHDTQTLLLQGPINVTDKTVTVYKNSTGIVADQGWNLISNPFASAIDWDQVASGGLPGGSKVEGAIYLFNDLDGSGSRSNYIYYIPATPGTGGTYGVGTQSASKYIPVGQGFFIRTKNDAVNVQLKAAYRVHNNQPFVKEVHPDLLRMNITATNQNTDEMIIRLLDSATLDFDGNLDSRKLFPSNPQIPIIYSITSDNVYSPINSIPVYTENTIILLGVNALAGEYTISVSEQTFENGRIIYLYDKLLNKEIQLEANSTYSFNHSGGKIDDRFELIFKVNNAPYVINTLYDVELIEDEDFSYEINPAIFDDIDENDYLSIFVSNNPTWMNFDQNNTILSGTPDNNAIGSYDVEILAFDKFGESASTFLHFDVLNSNDAPYLKNSINNIQISEDINFEHSIPQNIFNDIDTDDILIYESILANGNELPEWLDFNNSELKFTGIPENEDVGIYEIAIIATDLYNESAIATFEIEVVNMNDVPVVNSLIPDFEIFTNEIFNYQINNNMFTDVDINDELTYSISTTNALFPAWFNFDNQNFNLTGFPLDENTGTYNFEIKATDNFGSFVFDSFIINVVKNNTTYLRDDNNQISIFPNPGNGIFNVVLNYSGDYELQLVDQIGRKLLILNDNKSNLVLNLTDYSIGVYYVIVNFSNGTKQFEKLILQK